MEIFRKLLLPISSEFFSEDMVRRASELSKIFGSEIYVLYIVEEKTLKKMEEVLQPFLTDEQRKRVEKEIENMMSGIAEIVFERVEKMIPSFTRHVRMGEFSDVVRDFVDSHDISCIIMGFEKECFVRYRLLESLSIPIWVENGDGSIVVGACSNLAPNVKVPLFTMELAEKLGREAHLLYIIDVTEKVEVDEHGNKMERSVEELRNAAEDFRRKYGERARVEVVEGRMEEEIVRYARKNNAHVTIVGREMKKRGVLSKELRKEMVEKIKNSILFLN